MIGIDSRFSGPRNSGAAPDALARLLLVEDDDGDAFLVTELLLEAGITWPVERVRNLSEAAAALTSAVDCVLLDLGLPDADDNPDGLGALYDLREIDPLVPVLVLTGLDDEARGAAAVFAGAQDYLVKGQVDGHSLARAVRYARERRRAEDSNRQLIEARMLQRENDRLTRGLLPQPQVRSADLSVQPEYRPGERRLVLGGDFYDVVEGVDGRLHLVVGDVSGHGPDEAALGVHLRVAWRTLVLAGVAAEAVLPILEDVLVRERRSEEIFATVCQLVVDADRAAAMLWLAGHPVPILLEPSCGPLAGEDVGGPPLGALPGYVWDRIEVALPRPWALALHTDGLFEGFADAAGGAADDTHPRARLGLTGLLDILVAAQGKGLDDVDLLKAVITEAERRNGGPMADDLALLLVRHDPRPDA